MVLGFDGNRVSLGDEKVLGMDSGDGRTRHKHTYCHGTVCLKWLKWSILCYVSFSTILKCFRGTGKATGPRL